MSQPCCPTPNRVRAWVPCRPWSAWYCRCCGDLTLALNPLLSFLWDAMVGWWWTGMATIDRDQRHPEDVWADRRRRRAVTRGTKSVTAAKESRA